MAAPAAGGDDDGEADEHGSRQRVLRIRRPDDWHLHLRSGDTMRAVLPFSAERFARAIVMPNLRPPVTTVAAARAYRDDIVRALAADGEPRRHQRCCFTPLMTLYLTESTTPEEVRRAAASGFVHACKLYPAGATTNSASGVTDIERIYPVLDAMQECGLVLCVHGEVTDAEVDVFDREAAFLERVLEPLLRLQRFARLRIVLEHVTTARAAELVRRDTSGRLAATVTAHHMLCNRNALFAGAALRPHMYCLPVLKTEADRRAIIDAIRNDDSGRFFLGTDSAPHARSAKEGECCSAGVFSAPAAVELYAEAFEAAGMLHRLEAFASLNGPRFYGLAPNADYIELRRVPRAVPEAVPLGAGGGKEGGATAEAVRPFRAGESVAWSVYAAEGDHDAADARGPQR